MDTLFKNRILELANRSYQTNTFTFTEFLSLAEQSDILNLEKEITFAGFEMFGGYEGCEQSAHDRGIRTVPNKKASSI